MRISLLTLMSLSRKRTNSSVSFIEKQAAERAGAMSTSSTSSEIFAYTRFQSSTNGPAVVFLGRTPTLFCSQAHG